MFGGFRLVCFVKFLTISLTSGTNDFYLLGPEGDYATAETECSALGMSVTMPKTPADFEDLQRFISESSIGVDVWLGLNYFGVSDPTDFLWADGSSLSWAAWGEVSSSSEPEPNHLGSDKCVIRSDSNNGWHTRGCSEHYRIVCEQPSLSSYFRRLNDVSATETPVSVVLKTTWSGCAALCVEMKTCVLLELWKAGQCHLYDSNNTTSVLSNSSDSRTYIRIRR